MKPVFLNIGPVTITWFLLFFVTLTIMGYIILKMTLKNNKYKDVIEDYYLLELILGFVGARLSYVVFHLDLYKDSLKAIFRPNHYNLNLLGGVVFAFVILLVTTKIKKEDFLEILNRLLTPFYFVMAIGIWAFEFEGIFSKSSANETLVYSIMFFIIFIVHSLSIEKYKRTGLITLPLSMISYYLLDFIF